MNGHLFISCKVTHFPRINRHADGNLWIINISVIFIARTLNARILTYTIYYAHVIKAYKISLFIIYYLLFIYAHKKKNKEDKRKI